MENWKDIPGHHGYQVSDRGNMRSVDRVIQCSNGVYKKLRGKILKPCDFSVEHPYQQVMLGQETPMRAHVAVALAFLGFIPVGSLACHKDGNPRNNDVGNLYIGSPLQNQHDRVKHGTAASGEDSSTAKISKIQSDVIKARLAAGDRQIDIARDFRISQACVSHINTGRTWS